MNALFHTNWTTLFEHFKTVEHSVCVKNLSHDIKAWETRRLKCFCLLLT